MVIKKKEIEEVEVIDKLICDRCKKEHDYYLMNDQNFGSMAFYPALGSPFDMSTWQLELCEDCWWATYEFITGTKPEPDDPNLESFVGCLSVDRIDW